MMWITAASLRLRSLVLAVAAVLLAGGIWQMRQMPLDAVPEFSPLSLQVRTEALGLSATEVESLITVPMEADLLNGVPWLKSIESESATGLSSIEMFFAPGTDLMQARQMVQERLTQAHALPNVSSPPVLLQPISTANRILNVGLSSKTVSLIEMSVQAKWNIVPRLVGIPGVSNVSIWGQRNRQVQVLVDPARMHRQGVTLEQVVKTAGEAVWASPLTYLNSSTPGTGGFIDTPNQRLNIRHLFPITTAKDFAAIPVAGTSLALHEVADVVESHQPLIGDALFNDGPGLLLVVEKFPGVNTVAVTQAVEAAIAELRPGMAGIELDTTIYRPASFVAQATENLSTAILMSAVLAAIALGILMGSWRAAVVAGASIGLSLAVAGLVFHLRGINLNMMVVAGLLLAIAVVVDDAIVDADNILRRLRGRTAADGPIWAIIAKASVETRGPLFYAVLILLVAAAPVLFMQGLSAMFFTPLVWSYIVGILASLAVAVIVAPAMALVLMGRVAPDPAPGGSAVLRWLQNLYGRFTETGVRSPAGAYLLIACGVGAAALVWFQQERSLVPSFKETDVFIEWQAQPGTSLEAMERTTAAAIRDLRAIPGVRNAAAQLGRALLTHEVADVHSAEIWVSLDPKADYEDTLAALRGVAGSYPGITGQVQTFLSKKMRESLTGEDEAIAVRIYGHDQKILREKAEDIRQVLTKIEGVRTPRVEQQAEQPSIEIEVDLDRARAHGLKPGDVRRAASALIGGITVGALFQDQKVFDVIVWGHPDIRGNLNDIENLPIDTEKGDQVRLIDVADVRIASTPSIIHRQGVSRRIDIEAEVSGRSLSAVTEEARRRIQDVAFPFEYHAQVVGEHIERKATLNSLYSYVVAAAVLIVLLLQAALGSWRLAGLSLLGVPVACLGGFLAIYVGSDMVTLGSLLGLTAILGLALRNGILLVRRAQALELQEPDGSGDWIWKAAAERFPAILATATTLALIVLPFVMLGDVAGLEILHPACVAILGGLVSTTVLTLFVIPTIYAQSLPRMTAETRIRAAEIA